MKKISMFLTPVAAVALALAMLPANGASPGTNGLLVFERSQTLKNGSHGERDVWVRSASGVETRLTNAPGDDHDAVFSPSNADLIAYSSQGGDASADLDLWLMRSDGSDQRPLVGIDGKHEGVPSWSPDGSKLVFGVAPLNWASNGFDLYTVDVFAPSPVAAALVTHAGYQGYPAWSPKGDLIAYEGDVPGKGNTSSTGIYVYSLATKASTLLTPSTLIGYTPQWTPDGNRIVFRGKTSKGGTWAVYSMKPDGTDLKVVFDDGVFNPEVSPDGTRLVFRKYNSATSSFDIGEVGLRADGTADPASFSWTTSTPDYDSQPHYQAVTVTPTISTSPTPCLLVPPVC